jgi:predicted RNA-binding protein YlxR (DUF448 family)
MPPRPPRPPAARAGATGSPGPRRSCVVSRATLPSADLLRLSIDAEGTLVVVPPGAPGRGAWVDPSATHLRLVMERPGLTRRSLRAPPRRVGPLLEQARANVDAALQRALVRAWRSGIVRVVPIEGARCLRTRPSGGPAPAPAPAADLPALPWTAAELGALLGRGPLERLWVLAGGPSRLLEAQLRRRERLGYDAAPPGPPPGDGRDPRDPRTDASGGARPERDGSDRGPAGHRRSKPDHPDRGPPGRDTPAALDPARRAPSPLDDRRPPRKGPHSGGSSPDGSST